MKTTEINSYHMPELERDVNAGIEKIEQTLPIRAELAALNNDPPLSNTDIGPYWREYHLLYQEQMDSVGRRIPREPLENEMRERQQMTDRKAQLLNNELSGLREQGKTKEQALQNKQKPLFNKFRIKVLLGIAAVILVIDAIVTAPVFQDYGFNLLESFCMAAVFAILLFFAAHYFEPTVRKGKTPLQKRIIAATIITVLIVISYLIADTRARFFVAQSTDAGGAAPANAPYLPLLFVVFSMGTFFVGVAIRYHSLPKPEQLAAMLEYGEMSKAREANDADIQRVEREIKEATEKNAEVQAVNRSILNFGKDLEKYIISKAHGGLEQWKRHNAMHRPDRGRPHSFNDTTYPFEFTSSFTAVNESTAMNRILFSIMLIVGVMFFSCTTKQQSSYDVDIAIIIDATSGKLTAYPTAEEIAAPLALKDNPWMGCRITCTYFSDRDVNATEIITLPPQSEWSGNIVLRRARVRHFIRELQRCLTAMKPTGSCQHSIIFRTVARQCNQLAVSLAKRKYCLVLSDLYENSTDMNFYDPRTMALLRINPQRVQKCLEQNSPLSPLQSVQVWLLFNPDSYRANNDYVPVATFYQHLLGSHGAMVHIGNTFLPL